MAILISLITFLALGILRHRQRRLFTDAWTKDPKTKPLLNYSLTLRLIQSGATWILVFCVAIFALWFMGICPDRRSRPLSEDINIGIGIMLFTAGALGTLAEYSLFQLIRSIPNVQVDLIKYQKEAIFAQILKWLLVVTLFYCWITIISITFACME